MQTNTDNVNKTRALLYSLKLHVLCLSLCYLSNRAQLEIVFFLFPAFKINKCMFPPLIHGYVPLVVSTSRSFPRSWRITGFVTRLTRWVSLVEQELLILPEHLSSPPLLSGVRVTWSLALYVCFVDRCLSFCTFSFGHCVVCSS
jgi:hypothetical protein